MRVAPLGAYFAGETDALVEHARRSAEVTHAHPEGKAGAVAVALAAARACSVRAAQISPAPEDFLDAVLERMPESEVQRGILKARGLPAGTTAVGAASMLGNGDLVSAQDTVPFALWCAAHHLDNYEEALWATVSGLGDRDTNCAIVGGIVVCYTGVEGIPAEWRASREPLADWHLVD